MLQQSSSLFWDNAKDSLGVLNPTPFSGLTASGIDIGIYNTIGSEGNLSVRGFSSLGGISRSAYGAVGSNYYLEKTTGNLRRSFGDLVSVMEMASGGFQFKTASAGAVASLISLTELMRINANGNVLINTTTDAGFRLDVNGTARMGTLRLLNTSDTLEFANTLVRIRRVANTMFLDAFNGFTFFDSTSSLDRVKIFANGNFAINTTTDAGFRLDVNGTARFNGNLTFQTTSWVLDNGNAIMHRGGFNVESIAFNSSRMVFTDNNGFVFNGSNSSATLTASSIVDIQSTTKGFLPPRMTTTQKNAIARTAMQKSQIQHIPAANLNAADRLRWVFPDQVLVRNPKSCVLIEGLTSL